MATYKQTTDMWTRLHMIVLLSGTNSVLHVCLSVNICVMVTSVTLTAKMYSLHCFQSPFFIALDAATTCSRMLSGGPILPKQ